MVAISEHELRRSLDDMLRRARSGEQIPIAVAGQIVAQLGPVRSRQWIDTADLQALWDLPSDPELARDLQRFG